MNSTYKFKPKNERPAIHKLATRFIKKTGGISTTKRIYELINKACNKNGWETPKLDSVRGVLGERTAKDPEGRIGRIAKANKDGQYLFERIANGVYKLYTKFKCAAAMVICGDGRKLDEMDENGCHLIIADHPYPQFYNRPSKKQKNYDECYKETIFHYTLADFKRKAEVLISGGYLVEFVQRLSGTNWKYINCIITLAEEAGLYFYEIVHWKKRESGKAGIRGRSEKLSEDILLFTNGKVGRRLSEKGKPYLTKEGLPEEIFCPPPKIKTHDAEKPVSLIQKILNWCTLEDDIVLDQYAGSGVVGEACLKTNRNAILYESQGQFVSKIQQRLHLTPRDEIKIEFNKNGQGVLPI